MKSVLLLSLISLASSMAFATVDKLNLRCNVNGDRVQMDLLVQNGHSRIYQGQNDRYQIKAKTLIQSTDYSIDPTYRNNPYTPTPEDVRYDVMIDRIQVFQTQGEKNAVGIRGTSMLFNEDEIVCKIGE